MKWKLKNTDIKHAIELGLTTADFPEFSLEYLVCRFFYPRVPGNNGYYSSEMAEEYYIITKTEEIIQSINSLTNNQYTYLYDLNTYQLAKKKFYKIITALLLIMYICFILCTISIGTYMKTKNSFFIIVAFILLILGFVFVVSMPFAIIPCKKQITPITINVKNFIDYNYNQVYLRNN